MRAAMTTRYQDETDGEGGQDDERHCHQVHGGSGEGDEGSHGVGTGAVVVSLVSLRELTRVGPVPVQHQHMQ